MAGKKKEEPLVPDIVSEVAKTKSVELAKQYPDVFTQQLLDSPWGLAREALSVVKEDAQFRADVFTKLAKARQDTIKNLGTMGQKEIDDAYETNQLIRKIIDKFLEDGEISPAELEFLFMDLKFYHGQMRDARREVQASYERSMDEGQEDVEIAAKNSGIGNFVAGAGFGVLGWELGKLLYNTFIKKK